MDDETIEKLMIPGMPPASFPSFSRLAIELQKFDMGSNFLPFPSL
jgi:hypothetical protein